MHSSQDENRELLDVLDDDGERTDEVLSRGEVHSRGLWHRSFHLWIVSSDRLVLFQRRADSKQVEPGRIDVSAAGHYGAGEDQNAVLREVDEELGFLPEAHELHHLVTRRTERFYDDVTDREFQDVYLLQRDAPLTSYLLDCSETSVLYELPLGAAIELHRTGSPIAVAGWDCQGRHNNALLHDDDVIWRAREHTAEVLEQISRWLDER